MVNNYYKIVTKGGLFSDKKLQNGYKLRSGSLANIKSNFIKN